MIKKGLDEREEIYSKNAEISNVADKGISLLCSMGSLKKMPFSLDDLHFFFGQVSKIPLNTDEVSIKAVIGPEAKKPLKVSSPIMFSGMSYGAVSKNVRLVLVKVALKLNMGINSGEDFVLPEELDIASKNLIVQYSTGRVKINEESEEKFSDRNQVGQGAFPGWESLLPAEKVPPELAKLMELKEWEALLTPAHHPDIKNELKEKVRWLRELTDGILVGAKIGCGNVRRMLKF